MNIWTVMVFTRLDYILVMSKSQENMTYLSEQRAINPLRPWLYFQRGSTWVQMMSNFSADSEVEDSCGYPHACHVLWPTQTNLETLHYNTPTTHAPQAANFSITRMTIRLYCLQLSVFISTKEYNQGLWKTVSLSY